MGGRGSWRSVLGDARGRRKWGGGDMGDNDRRSRQKVVWSREHFRLGAGRRRERQHLGQVRERAWLEQKFQDGSCDGSEGGGIRGGPCWGLRQLIHLADVQPGSVPSASSTAMTDSRTKTPDWSS